MPNPKRYPIAKQMMQMATVLGIDAERVMRKAGLSPDVLGHEGKGVTAKEYFTIWDAAYSEVGDAAFVLETARQFAGSPFLPAILAFSSSPNTEIGLSRMALFKPLVGPVKLDVSRMGNSVDISISSTDPGAPMPPGAAAFEVIYFLESARKFTASHIIPLRIGLPEGAGPIETFEDYFGVAVSPSSVAKITLSLEDALRPLISENAEFWDWLEVDLKRQLADREGGHAVSERVRAALVEMLPSGDASTDAVCQRLGMSKRSLQRRLKAEDETFQSILDATRSELSIKYLTKGDVSIEEISYLLAYRDPNSFYRAFHGWTGMTPSEARGQTLQ